MKIRRKEINCISVHERTPVKDIVFFPQKIKKKKFLGITYKTEKQSEGWYGRGEEYWNWGEWKLRYKQGKDIPENYEVVFNSELYNKAYIRVHMKNGSSYKMYYNSDKEALEVYNRINREIEFIELRIK